MAYLDRLDSINNYFSEDSVKLMNISLWINDRTEFALFFADEEDYDLFRESLCEQYMKKERFCWVSQGFYLDTFECESIHMFEEA